MKKLKILSIILLFALFIALPFYNNVQATTFAHLGIDMQGVSDEECIIHSHNGGMEYIIKQSADLNMDIYGADFSEIVSSNESVAKVDSTTGKLNILSTGKCTLSLEEKEDRESPKPIELLILSDQTFEEAKSDYEALKGLKITGNQTRWYLEGELGRFDEGEILVGGTGQVVLADGSKLSGATYSIKAFDDGGDTSYLSIDENGVVTASGEGRSAYIYVVLNRGEYTLSGSIYLYGVKEFTIPKPDGEDQEANPEENQGQVPEQNGNQNEEKPQENAPQSNGTQSENRTLDNEPKTGIDTKTSAFVSWLALVTLAVAIITRKI